MDFRLLPEPFTLETGKTYHVRLHTPGTWSKADVEARFGGSSPAPGTSGTWRFLPGTLVAGDVSGLIAGWEFTGVWYGPTTTLVDTSDFQYPAVFVAIDVPAAPSPDPNAPPPATDGSSTPLWAPVLGLFGGALAGGLFWSRTRVQGPK